jgi:lipopolysaccharide export LptBFGC system permease protein LptF
LARSISENFKEFTAAIQSYIDSTIKYHQLDLFKKGTKGVTASIHAVLLLFFGLIALLFLSVAASIFIGYAVDNLAIGYLIVGGIYLLIFCIVLFFLKPWISKKVLQTMSKSFYDNNEDIKVEKYENVQELRGD